MSDAARIRPVTLFGLSHRTAPVSVRERLAFSPLKVTEALQRLRDECSVDEAVIISTCNRVEIYSPLREGTSPEVIGRFLCRFHDLPEEELRGRTYTKKGPDAVRHVFRVASSLDSQVVGESQVLAQVKSGYLRAKAAGHTGKTLNLLFQKALKVGKDVRTKTRIGETGVSVSSVAIGFMKKIFEDLRSKVVMVIGSGEMGKVTLGQLSRQGVKQLLIVNRSQDRAEELASRFGGDVVTYESLTSRLGDADVVITSTAAPHAIIHEAEVRAAMKQRRHSPQVYMDIAIPRDVEPGVGKIANVFLYNVDDLDRVISQHLEGCAREVSRGEEIVDQQVEAYLALHARMDLGPVISQMRGDLRVMIRKELSRTLRGDPRLAKDDEALDALANRLTGKIMHGPIQALREGTEDGVAEEVMHLVRHLFSENGMGLQARGRDAQPSDARAEREPPAPPAIGESPAPPGPEEEREPRPGRDKA